MKEMQQYPILVTQWNTIIPDFGDTREYPFSVPHFLTPCVMQPQRRCAHSEA